MSRTFRIARQAKQDLDEIFAYVARDSEQNAVRVLDAMLEAMRHLAWMPGLGHVREELNDSSLRVWPVYSYLIIYRIEKKCIRIVCVVSGYRDLSSLFRKR